MQPWILPPQKQKQIFIWRKAVFVSFFAHDRGMCMKLQHVYFLASWCPTWRPKTAYRWDPVALSCPGSIPTLQMSRPLFFFFFFRDCWNKCRELTLNQRGQQLLTRFTWKCSSFSFFSKHLFFFFFFSFLFPKTFDSFSFVSSDVVLHHKIGAYFLLDMLWRVCNTLSDNNSWCHVRAARSASRLYFDI